MIILDLVRCVEFLYSCLPSICIVSRFVAYSRFWHLVVGRCWKVNVIFVFIFFSVDLWFCTNKYQTVWAINGLLYMFWAVFEWFENLFIGSIS